MRKELFTNYRKLLVKVDDFSSGLTQTYREHFVCRCGCTDCCQQDLHLLPVEFHFLLQGFSLLPEAKKKIIRARTVQGAGQDIPCPLLQEGRCILYGYRPVVCRTHGLPLLITGEGEERRDCCPKNFVGHSLGHLPRSDLLDLERLNTILIAVNMVFASHVGVEAGVRLPVSRLATHNHNISSRFLKPSFSASRVRSLKNLKRKL